MTSRILQLLFLLIVVNVRSAYAQSSDGFHYDIGDTPIDIELKDLNNQSFKLSDLRGKPVIISLFSTSCRPCIGELNFLYNQLAEKYDNGDVEILAIGCGHVPLELEYFNEDYLFNFIFIPDFKKSICNQLAHSGVPRCILIDKDGRIIAQKAGFEEYELLGLIDLVK